MSFFSHPLLLSCLVTSLGLFCGCDLIASIPKAEEEEPDQSITVLKKDMASALDMTSSEERDMPDASQPQKVTLVFEPSSRLEFRSVAKGETSSTILSLLNQSPFPVTIENLTIQEEGLGDTGEVALALPWSSRTLDSGEQVLVNVVWRPTDDELDYGTLSARISSPTPGLVTLGFATPKVVIIDPAVMLSRDVVMIDMVGAPHRESLTQAVVISLKEGSAPFVFSEAYLTHALPLSSMSQEQVKLLNLPAQGERFESGDSFSFSLEFSPKDYFSKQGEVVIQGESSALRVAFNLVAKRPLLHQSFEHGALFACALDDTQKVMCWGSDTHFQVSKAPATGSYLSIATGTHHACVLDALGKVTCWGQNREGESKPPEGLRLKQVVAGYIHSCGLKEDDTVVCWGSEGGGRLNPPSGTFVKLFGDNRNTCGLREDSSLECWGPEPEAQNTPPAPVWFDLDVGLGVLCGIDGQLSLKCWGSSQHITPDSVPQGKFEHVSLSETFACASRVSGEVICWGDASTPDAVFSNAPKTLAPALLSTGYRAACAVFNDRLSCWGQNENGLLPPPAITLFRPTQ